MKSEHELRRELEIITENLTKKPDSETYKAYKQCLEWVLES